jgi:RNA polymerase sigma-70 factor (ECF subfamily)
MNGPARTMAEQPGEITQALLAATEGDEAAAHTLWALVYDALRQIAQRELRRELRRPTLSSTGLVHETYLKLVGQAPVEWHNRAHFYAIACKAMRQILVDHARARRAVRRRGRQHQVPLDEALHVAETRSEDLIALDEALTRLAAFDERMAQVVECRFFGGLTAQETAEVMGLSKRTADREWRRAKTYLYRMLEMDE